ncbi:MAG TPA: TIGR01777 family oxidoreductase [Thermoanaerobaculia bacterium]|nr:TIGR01777 family oxidoreductase [Thermoanaerobaculia bacterium]
MRVLITGGSGLIGRALAASLAADGHEVVVLSRRPEGVHGLPPGARAEGWEPERAGPWADLLDGAVVVHLAGDNLAEGRWTAEKKRRIRDSRVLSGQALARAIEAGPARPEAFLQSSAVGYYGFDRGEEEVAESAAPGDDFLGRVCVEWEASTAGLDALGIRRPILRTGLVLSGAGGALPQMALPFRLFVGGPVGRGSQVLPWIHEIDEVRAIRFLIDHPTASGPFNLTAPSPVPFRAMARALGRSLRRPSLLPVPAFALRLLLGEKAELVLGGQRAVPKRLLELGFSFRFPELEPALADLLR